jgi:hypothetical protein
MVSNRTQHFYIMMVFWPVLATTWIIWFLLGGKVIDVALLFHNSIFVSLSNWNNSFSFIIHFFFNFSFSSIFHKLRLFLLYAHILHSFPCPVISSIRTVCYCFKVGSSSVVWFNSNIITVSVFLFGFPFWCFAVLLVKG